MPELPGPSDDLDEQQRRAWLEGAATVAQLQADQWAIIAKQYRDAINDGDDQADEDADADGECPECGGTIVDGLGGDVCLNCGHEPDDDDD